MTFWTELSMVPSYKLSLSSELGPEKGAQSLCLGEGLHWQEVMQGVYFWVSWSLKLWESWDAIVGTDLH